MPKKRLPRYLNAASVRRRLLFDEDSSDGVGGVTYSVGRCVSDSETLSDNGSKSCELSKNLPQLSNITHAESEQFHELLWTNPEPLINSHRASTKHNGIDLHTDPRPTYHAAARIRHWDEEGNATNGDFGSAVAYLIFLLCVLFILLSFVPWSSTLLEDLQIDHDTDHRPQILFKNKKIICLFGLLTSIGIGFAIAVFCCGFSWIIIYFDSMSPGQIPPTPLSPSKYRKKSGHTFHLNYAISMINGFVVFCYYLWLNSDNYLR